MSELPDNIRAFDDTTKARDLIYGNVMTSLKNKFPIEDDDYRLELSGLKYSGPQKFTMEQEKKALMNNRRLRVPIKGKWRLVDKATNTTMDEREDIVMHVPYYTDRGTIIYNGNEFSVVNQARLKPGAYVRKRRTGEVETQFNVRPGSGKSFRVQMEPETGIFRVAIDQSKVPIYPLLSSLGVTDKELQELWGPGVLEANMRKRDPRALHKLYKRLSGYKYDPELDDAAQQKYIAEALPTYQLDPDVIAHTLGLPNVTGIDKATLLRATQKMINVSRGEEGTDDRDSPIFSDIYSVEDLMAERIDKDAGRLARTLLWKARRAKGLKPVVRGALNPYMESLLLSSGLAMPLEETNPLSTLEQLSRISKLGEGGISSAEAITDEARDVNPGQFGFIDPIAGPEGLNIGIDVRAAYKTFKGTDKRLYAEFKDPASGRKLYLSPNDVQSKVVAFPGEMTKKGPLAAAMVNGKIKKVPKKEVDLEVPSYGHMSSPNANLVPMPTALLPGRNFYAMKFFGQYMPQVKGELPLVDSLAPGGKDTFSEYYGRKLGTVRSAVGGVVSGVNEKGVTVTDDNGKKHMYETVKNFPFNRLSVTGDTEVFIRRDGTNIKIRIEDYVAHSGDEVLSYDPATKKSTWQRIQGFTAHKNTKRLFRVEFRSGRHVDVTEDHSLLTLDDAWNLVPVFPLDCVIGQTRCPVVCDNNITESEWSEEDGILDGLYLSEGCVKKQKGLLQIAVEPVDRSEYVTELLLGLGESPHNSKAPDRTWTDHARWNRWTTDFGKYAHGKYIAPHVYQRGTRYLRGLIAGYMGGDGCLNADVNGAIQVCAGSVSEQLRDDLISVFTLLGIFATYTGPRYNGKNCLDIYKLRVRSSDLHKLDKWFCYPDRQAKFESLLAETYRATDSDHLPLSRATRKMVYAAYPGRPPHFVYKSATQGRIAKARLTGCAGVVGAWANSDILWDTVETIDPIEHQDTVYDFSVCDSEAFATAHGLLVHNTGISYFPAVEKGDRVNVGDMVAHSNFTDSKTGALNMGQNLRTAIIPARGMSFEDAYVISESSSKKLATERLYGYDQETKGDVNISRSRYISSFPSKFSKKQAETVDKDGVVAIGTRVQKGDPLILAVGPKLLTSADAQLGKLHKVLRNSFTDKSVVWEHDSPGVVVDTAMTASGVKVNVRSTPPVKVGDKLSTRFGLKGVVGHILDDDQMPRQSSTDEPYELLLNPMAILSRVAPAQLIEMQLAKVAKKTGKQVRLPQQPPEEGWANWAMQQLKDAGVEEATAVFDPHTGKTVQDIADGLVYTSAFHHLAEKKLSSRGESGQYTIDDQPAKGGPTGAKRFCFLAKQPIKVHGGEETIGHIVEKQAGLSAWTYAGGWGYSPITDWFVRDCPVDDILTIKVEYLPTTRKGRQAVVHTDRALWVTKQHDIYRPDMSKVKAEELRAGDWVAGEGYPVTAEQNQILLGSMLGDGSICDKTFYSEQHSCKQSDYLKWKRAELSTLVSSRSFNTTKATGYKPGRVCYMNIHRPDVVADLYSKFYSDGVKRVTPAVLDQLDDLAVAVWLLDDGFIGNHSKKKGRVSLQGSLATCAFTTEENTRISDWLNARYGGHTTVNTQNHIYLDKVTSEALADVVASWIPYTAIPKSKRWLRAYAKQRQADIAPCISLPPATVGVIPLRVRSVAPYKHDKPGVDTVKVYDVTVAHAHRYVAGGVLVSNSSMDMYATLAHGATDVIKDVQLIRGTRNEEFWKALKLGRPLPEPDVPFIYKKFLNTLKAGGINIEEKGDVMKLMPMTDGDVSALSKGAINKSAMITPDFEPRPGGLFDVGKTGGMAGNRWTHIDLPMPVPNPVMEEPIRRLLGLKEREMRDILSGTTELDGAIGGDAMKKALEKIDIDKSIAHHKERALSLRGSNRDNSIKVLGYLTAMKKQGMHPSSWMISKVPVLPPVFRPVSRMGDIALQSDMNEMYKDLIEMSNTVRELRTELPEDALAAEKLNLYDAVKATYGLGESITPEGQSKRIKGAIRQVIGNNPKHGLFQSKVLSKPVDVVGRGVVVPDPNLDMDSAGIPADSAWTLYKDFVMRRLVRKGYPPVQAQQLIEDRKPEAEEQLHIEMKERPVIIDRAPTWHKFNLLAFHPHIVDDDVIRVSPLIVKGFNMDFDGDQANFHVPISDKAVEQAKSKMMPSKNLFSLTDLRSIQHSPSMEMTMGLYWLTRQANKKQPRKFATTADAKKAYNRGDIGANDPVIIG